MGLVTQLGGPVGATLRGAAGGVVLDDLEGTLKDGKAVVRMTGVGKLDLVVP